MNNKYNHIHEYALNLNKFYLKLPYKYKKEYLNYVPYENGTDDLHMFLTTLFIPNDVEFLNLYKECKKDSNAMARRLSLPSSMILFKLGIISGNTDNLSNIGDNNWTQTDELNMSVTKFFLGKNYIDETDDSKIIEEIKGIISNKLQNKEKVK